MSDGSYVDCTEYHKFYVKDANGSYKQCKAIDLQKGNISESPKHFPIISSNADRANMQFDSDKLRDCEVPYKFRIYSRLLWLSRRFDEDAGYMQITSDDIDWLREIKLMCNTIGVAPFITNSPRGYHLRFCSEDVEMLLTELMIPLKKKSTDYHYLQKPDIYVVSVKELEGLHDTFCFNEPILHKGVFNGVYTGNCAEINIYSDTNNIGVCNLASICLPKFVKNVDDKMEFNYQELYEVMQKVVYNMNKVIDNNKYPLEQARYSDEQNRPIGVGVQGLSEVFMIMKTPFDSSLAMDINKKIFETMYYAALVASNKLAQVYGPYKNFSTSMTASGILQFDLWDVTPSDMWDWSALKHDIITTGLYNSLLLAQMPTAGTSIISGHTESIEVPQSNIFTRSTLSGRFQIINKHLVNDLKSIKLWKKSIRNKIIENDGSVQFIEEIPQRIRDVYKTVYEYKLTSFIKMGRDRGAFICQSSSNNRYLPKPDVSILTNMHLFAWKNGEKCSSYYVRIKPQNLGKKLLEKNQEEECLSCTA